MNEATFKIAPPAQRDLFGSFRILKNKNDRFILLSALSKK